MDYGHSCILLHSLFHSSYIFFILYQPFLLCFQFRFWEIRIYYIFWLFKTAGLGFLFFFYLLIWHNLSTCGVLLMLFFNVAQPRLSRLVAATKTAYPHCYQCDDVCFSFEWLKSLLLLSFYRPFLPALLLLRNCGSVRRLVFMLL